MVELLSEQGDDTAFLALIERIVNGAITILEMREAYLVHVDNWFDHKWLGWWSRWGHRDLQELYVPPFNPNRVLSQKHFICEGESLSWALTGKGKPLHVRQPGRHASAQKLNQVSKSAAFIWYSGNTISNGVGSMMLYLSGSENYAWYASFKKDAKWAISDSFRITQRELMIFEERGNQIQPAKA